MSSIGVSRQRLSKNASQGRPGAAGLPLGAGGGRRDSSEGEETMSEQEGATGLALVLKGMAVAIENLNARIVAIEWRLGMAEDEGKENDEQSESYGGSEAG